MSVQRVFTADWKCVRIAKVFSREKQHKWLVARIAGAYSIST